MTTTIAIAGKGGTGKTTIASLLAKALSKQGTVLAIDADPSVNLHMALGLGLPDTVGDIREEVLTAVGSGNVPAGMNKHEYIAMSIQDALVESTGMDLLAMGRPEGPGCYCAANYILRTAIDRLAGSYDYVVIDNEAGMEHISRRTTRDLDVVLLVSDLTVRGITAAGRMLELLHELQANAEQVYLVLNRAPTDLPPEIEKVIREQKLQLLATIPQDPLVGEFDALGRPLAELPSTTPVQQGVWHIAHKLGLVTENERSEAPVSAASPREGHPYARDR